MDPAVRGNKSGNHLLIGINWDRSLDEMFSDFTGSGGVVMAAISAGKSRWVNCCYGNNIVVGVEQVQCFSESKPEVQGFYPAKKFMERCEMGYDWKIKDRLNFLHISKIFDKLPIMLVPVVFKENKNEKLVLGERLFRVFTGIRGYSRWLYNRNGRLDKPDIPARRFLNCLLTLCAHIVVRRRCTLDLSVVGTTSFGLGFQQSR